MRGPPHIGGGNLLCLTLGRQDATQRPRLVDQIVKTLGDFDIGFGHATRIVRGKHENHFPVADVHIGVMAFVFSDFRHFAEKIHRFGKAIEFHGAGDGFAANFPFGGSLEEALEVVFG